MSSPTFLRIPLSKGSVIVPKSSIRRVFEDDNGICIEYRIGSSIAHMRPHGGVTMGTLADALKAQLVYVEAS